MSASITPARRSESFPARGRARGSSTRAAACASVKLQAYLGYCAGLDEKYDCTTCGACCFGKRDYVQVSAPAA
jgi:hypothetical protein